MTDAPAGPAPIVPTPSAYGYPLLLKQLLHTPLARAPEQEIVYRDAVRYRYRDFNGRLGRFANALQDLGVRPGTTVAIMDWDSHRYLECFFAVPMMGAVLMTVNVRLSPEQIRYCLNHARASVLLVHRDFLQVLGQIRGGLDHLDRLILIADGASPAIPSEAAGEYEALLAAAPEEYRFPDFDENAPATTFYTTGTTGHPKGVTFSHRQLVLHTLGFGLALAAPEQGQRLHGADTYMPLTPMFHVHGWGTPYLATLLGLKQIYPGRYEPALLLGLIEREGVTFSHCVPAILQMLLAAPEAASADLSRWKVVIGGSALPIGLARRAAAHGIEVWSGYGMSETCPVLTLSQLKPGADLDPEAGLARRCKTGLPVPLVQLRVVDHDMKERPRDGTSVGEVTARAPWLTAGYVGDEAASEELWRGGWLHTQDVGHVDDEGYLQITDRLKDVIKTGGEWVSSLELESHISTHPAVSEVAVVGVADDRWGERPLALVVAKPEQGLDPAAILDHLRAIVARGALPRYALPGRVLVIDAIPKTSVGKIDKKQLRRMFASA